MRHLIPWWLYFGKDCRQWMKFKRSRQKLEIEMFNCLAWSYAKVCEENDLFGIWR